MDNKFILEKFNTIEQLKKEKRVNSLELGFKFSDFFINEINKIDLVTSSKFCDDIKIIQIFDLNKKKSFLIKCSLKIFQDHLQFLYRQFIDEQYFDQFPWYKLFSFAIKDVLKKKFLYDSENAMNFVVRTVSGCFVYISYGNNKYNYKEINNFIVKSFTCLGISFSESSELSKQILKSLFDSKLLKSLNIFNEYFELSDIYMDIVFNLSSLFTSRIGFDDEIQFNANFELQNLSNIINNYNFNWSKKEEVILLKSRLDLNYYDLFNLLDNYSILNIDNNLLQNVPVHIRNISWAYYYNKIVLNEYCLQLMISNCFNSYSLNAKLKNILYSHRKLLVI